MEIQTLQMTAGIASTALFVSSNFPMLTKALRTRDMKSYSLTNLTLSNVGNLVHWLYVSSLPFGPIWLLHGFFTITTALMLLWYMRYQLITDRTQQLSRP